MKKRVFAIMPFGKQSSHIDKRIKIDFDSIYEKAIKPACEEMNMSIIRADEEMCGGIIHTLMFERLVCADIAIVDISNQNANVCYELGFRHCARENHTIIIFDKKSKLPFDFNIERAIPYELNKGTISNANANTLKESIKTRLKYILESNSIKDSPAFELIEGFPQTKLEEDKLQIYLKKQDNYNKVKESIKNSKNIDNLDECIKLINELDLNIKILAYFIIEKSKKLGVWDYIIKFLNKPEFKETYFKQQLALAYNKTGKIEDKKIAEQILNEILDSSGETSETLGLLGSIYKRYYEIETDIDRKNGLLDIAIEYYEKGFNVDTTDYYPGINLATLLLEKYQISSDKKVLDKMNNVLNVVLYNINLLINDNTEDYWLLATSYEANILSKDFDQAEKILNLIYKLKLKDKLIEAEVKSTYKNLNIIKNIYEQNHNDIDWFENFSKKLEVKEGM